MILTYACFAVFMNLTDINPVQEYCTVGDWADIDAECNRDTDRCELIYDPDYKTYTFEYTVNGGRDSADIAWKAAGMP